MYFALLWLSGYVAFLTAAGSVESKITASNGGVVLPGKTMTLSYKAKSSWTVCIWYRHDTPTEYQYCMFIRVKDQWLKKCSSGAFKDHLEMDGKDALGCNIRILNVTEADNARWSVRVDDVLTNDIVNVTVAVQPKNITVKADPLVVGKYGTISCHVTGSRPPPLVSHSFEEVSGVPSPEINSTVIKSMDDNGLFISDNVVVIKPTVHDHNRQVNCKEVQKVGDEQLFKPLEAQSKLNVTFPPLPRSDGLGSEEHPFVFGNKIGTDLEISISFFSNPRPNSVSSMFG